ncbi:MAG: hypothetical protein ACPGVP_04000 [Thiolinea sp.]
MWENQLADLHENISTYSRAKSFRFRFAVIFISLEAICLLGIIVFNSSVLQQESTRQFAEKTTLATGLLLEMLVNPLSQSDLSTARVVSQRFVNKEGLVKFEFFATDRNRLLMVNNQKYKTVQHELDQLSDQHFNSQRQTRLGDVFTVGDYSFITVQDALSISGNKVGTARFVYDISRNIRGYRRCTVEQPYYNLAVYCHQYNCGVDTGFSYCTVTGRCQRYCCHYCAPS